MIAISDPMIMWWKEEFNECVDNYLYSNYQTDCKQIQIILDFWLGKYVYICLPYK